MTAVASEETQRPPQSPRSARESRVDVPQTAFSSRGLVAKPVFDRGLALLLLIPGLPLIGLLVVLIRLTSKGPGIYSQLRVGQGGRTFTMYKLRSMQIDAEAATGPVWAGACNDPRVTLLGYWLRRMHLDELPQLFNVLRGDMSLVGPRPERPEFVTVLAEQIAGYTDRLAVLPGVTGLAQVNLPPDTDLNSVRLKLALDREYIREFGLWLDLRIIVCTFLRVCGLRGGRGTRLLGLQRTVFLPPDTAAWSCHADAPAATPHTIATNVAPSSAPKIEVRHDNRQNGDEYGVDSGASHRNPAGAAPLLDKA